MKLPAPVSITLGLFREAGDRWLEDRAPSMGAAIAFYTVFSLTPLMLIAIAVAGFVVDPDVARSGIVDALGDLVGADGSKAIRTMIESTNHHKEQGVFATVVGVLLLLFGATGAFAELQEALNKIWAVPARSPRGVTSFVRNRLLSFAMVLGIGFLLLVSLIATAVLSAVGGWMSSTLPGGAALWQVANLVLAYFVTTALFAMIFKILPDARLHWSDVAFGAAFTALLFTIGKVVIGVYLGKSGMATVYGAAASLAIVLIWVYFSAQILLFGAEFTRAFAGRLGSRAPTAPAAPATPAAPAAPVAGSAPGLQF